MIFSSNMNMDIAMNILNTIPSHKNSIHFVVDFSHSKYIFTHNIQCFQKIYSLSLGNIKVKMLLCTSFVPVLTENRNRKTFAESYPSSTSLSLSFRLLFLRPSVALSCLRLPVYPLKTIAGNYASSSPNYGRAPH